MFLCVAERFVVRGGPSEGARGSVYGFSHLRGVDCICHIYVAAYSFKNVSWTVAMYCACTFISSLVLICYVYGNLECCVVYLFTSICVSVSKDAWEEGFCSAVGYYPSHYSLDVMNVLDVYIFRILQHSNRAFTGHCPEYYVLSIADICHASLDNVGAKEERCLHHSDEPAQCGWVYFSLVYRAHPALLHGAMMGMDDCSG